MTQALDVIVVWKFDLARNAMGGETLTAYVNRSDRDAAWRVVRAKLPHADLLREVGMSASQLSWDNQSPFEAGEDLRFA